MPDFRCSECGRDCTTRQGLTRHMLTHTGEKPFRCDVCERGFVQASDLTRHMRTHTGEKPYSCDVCGKAFNRQPHLSRHARTHTDVRPYVCETCEKAFKFKRHLSDHARTHTGQKFLCPDCEASYTQRNSLNKHIQKHHSALNTPDITVSTHASAGIVTTTHSFNSGPGSPATSVSYICSTDEERTPVRVVTNSTPLIETTMVTQRDGKVIAIIQPRAESDPSNSSSQ